MATKKKLARARINGLSGRPGHNHSLVGSYKGMTLEHVEKFNNKLVEAVGLEVSIRELAEQGWMPKFLRRSGLPLHWAWAYEFSVVELVALVLYFTETSEEFLSGLKEGQPYDHVLEFEGGLDSIMEGKKKAKKKQVYLVICLLYALMHSLRAIGYHSLSVDELIQRGLAGDRVSLRHAVAVDPTILSAPSVAAYVAHMQLRGERRELALLYKAAANRTRKKLLPNWQLRYMERIMAEGGILEQFDRESVYRLVTERLKLYDSRGGDSFKGLFTLFSRWRKDATT